MKMDVVNGNGDGDGEGRGDEEEEKRGREGEGERYLQHSYATGDGTIGLNRTIELSKPTWTDL